MTPRPEVKESSCRRRQDEPLLGDEVVISGISGKFPESDSVRDFMHNLYNKVDMISEDDLRSSLDHPDIPQYRGKVSSMDKFDAQYFGVHYMQACYMDPMGRVLLETAYGAIIDAGINPLVLRNTKTAVYIGISSSDAEKDFYHNAIAMLGDNVGGQRSKSMSKEVMSLTGSSRNMLSNRISYWLGARGPSYTLQSECSSSLQALEHAYNSIRSGQCDAAVIGGANFCPHPFIALHLRRMGLLSGDGKTRSFDQSASGYGQGEAVNVILLQRAKDAKRVYAQVVHAKSNCEGFNSDGRVTYADNETQRAFLEGFYSEVDVLPAQVQYIEAFGTGIPRIDKNELDVIDEVFCKGRTDPLLVGCVKSNMGHAAAASGAVATTKLCLAYHKGVIAPNLHYSEPREDVAGVREGRIRVVTEPTPFPGGYTAASSYSFTGVNVHVLFKGLAHNKSASITDDLPRLVAVSSRSEESLKSIFEDLKSLPLNLEQLRLLHNIHEVPISGHVFRGYNVLKMKDGETVSVAQNVDYFPGLKRPVWFVYSGMGSQWSGMGTQLMRIPIFAAAIERCCRALAPKGVDVLRILTDPDPHMYDNILHSFVGIAAVQIGLTDLLTALGIQPDNIIGHSVGELGCAYADGCFTAEEMILSAYSRGLVSVQTPFIRGSMAAVGLGYDKIKSLCPPEIEVACHNGPNSSTISGPVDVMKKFVDELTAKGIFAKEVPCSNIAYHSRYIAQAGPRLLQNLREIVKKPKARSSRWLSTSVPQNKWDQPSAKLSSAEYHTNNLLSPVLFEETSRQIPSNAITIEVAPHGLLQAILRRSLAADCINVPLTKRDHSDNVQFFLDAVGKLFVAGVNPKISNIYPAVQFPVSASTPVMSQLVGWEHSEEWNSEFYHKNITVKSGERHCVMSLYDEEYKFIAGNVINGANIFPAAGYLVLAWETLAMMLGVHYSRLSVVFEGVRFESDAVVRPDSTLELIVMLQKANGNFEITAEGGIVASGSVYAMNRSHFRHRVLEQTVDSDECGSVPLSTDDVYRIMSSRGYSYKGEFRSIQSANISGDKGQIKFSDNWVTFLDAILQMNVLKRPSRGVSKPRLIESLKINVDSLLDKATSGESERTQCLDVSVYDLYNYTRCRGVELEGLVMTERAAVQETRTLEPYIRTTRPKEGQCGNCEYQPLQPVSVQSEHVYLASQRPEDISSLAWLEGPLSLNSKPSNTTKKLVQVYYSAVTHTDMQKASGRVLLENDSYQSEANQSCEYGMDFCGRTRDGERVMGLLATGALSSLVEADVDMLWPVPPHWSMEDAVTVPLAYANAFYCLETQGGIEPGMSVLVHSGTTALGQAAINICLALGCEVLTTVSSLQKKQWLLKLFPSLKEKYIGNSRSNDFEDMVLSATKEGCHIILNTLSGHLCTVSMRCLAPMGTFVNVNSEDYAITSPFGMSFLKLNRTFKAASISNILSSNVVAIKVRIQQLISEGIAKGYVQPLSRVVFGASEASRAFRFTSTGRHVGKVLLKLRDEELRPLVTPERALLPAQPHFLCSSNGNYVVIIGPNDSGLELADWLVHRGTKNLLLHSQELAPNGYQAFRIRSWQRRGVNVQLSSKSLQTEAGCLQLVKDAAKQGPLYGLFVAPQWSHQEQFQNVELDPFAKKALVVVNLDSATRKLCPQLKQFVVFTSAATTGRGAAGCSSASLADSVLEKICEERGKLGLPALALHWGVDGEVIYLSGVMATKNGCTDSTTTSHNILDQLLKSKHNTAAVFKQPFHGETKIRNTYSERISTLLGLGLESFSELNDEESLQHYSVNISSAREISSLLERDYRIFYTPARILQLKIAELKELESQATEKTTGMSEGLNTFFNYVDAEEFNAYDPLVRMPTLLSTGFETEENMYERGNYLVLIPGMESHKDIFVKITERLKLNAFTSQLGLEHLDDSIPDMAARLSQVILQKLRLEKTFFLFGYSFGVTVALEIAANMEKLGYVGKVFCLDGSPRWFAALLEAQLGHLSEQRLQDEVIKHMFRVMSASGAAGGGGRSDGGDVEEALQRSLAAESDWERKLDACMLHLRGRVKFSFQYQRSLVAMAYARIRQARAYSDAHLLSRPLRSELVLLKATRRPPSLSPVAAEELGRDYGLGAYSQRPLTVYELDCDHAAAPFDLNVSNILNKHVTDLEEFKKLNLCIPYTSSDGGAHLF